MDNDQATLNEPEKVEVPEVSIADTMRATFDSIRERNAAPDEQVKEAPAETEAKTDRARAADGKFAKTDDVAAEAGKIADAAKPVTPPAEGQAETANTPDPATAAVPGPTATAPSSWTNEGKAEFAKATPALQQEVLRREQQMHNGIAQYKDAATYGQSLHKAIQPFEQTIRQLGVTPDVAIGYLLKADNEMRYGAPDAKIARFAALAKEYGIDLSQGIPTPAPVDPQVQYLQQQLQQQQQQMQQFTSAQQQREQDELNSRIATFAKDRPHFGTLRNEMGSLIQVAAMNGEELSMSDAYDRAAWANPQVRQQLLTQQQADKAAEDAKRREEEVAKAATAAAAAKAASTTNIAKRGTLPASVPVGSIQETMRATLDNIRGRG